MQLILLAVTLSLVAFSEHGIAEGANLNDTELLAAEAQEGCDCLRWTPWINADENSGDGGDFETIGYNVRDEGGWPGRVTRYLAKSDTVCNTPARVQCRAARSQQPWFTAEDDTVNPRRVNCDSEAGFVCRDSQQADGRCQDYEVRLLCWTACSQLRWGPWFDRDNPGGSCDCEHPGWADHPVRNAPACPDGGSPMEVDCRTLTDVHAALAPNKAVTCSVDDGFSCWNSAQDSGTSCLDYKVRYLCGSPAP